MCRWFHKEAALVPYAENTLAFDSGLVLDLFVRKSLLVPQRKAIQSLQINGWLEGYKGWPGILPETVKLLRGLDTLTLSVSKRRSIMLAGPYLFSQLALKNVQVIVELDRQDHNVERRQTAEKIEHDLLAESRRLDKFITNGVVDQEAALRDWISRIPTCASCSNILVLKWTCQSELTLADGGISEVVDCSACGASITDRQNRCRIPPSATYVAERLNTTTQKLYKMLPRLKKRRPPSLQVTHGGRLMRNDIQSESLPSEGNPD